MLHPRPDQLLDDDATDVAAHVAGCEACTRLRGLLRPAQAAAAAGDGELPDLQAVDPAHYALHEELRDGVGGMGRTVRATDRRLGRTVAIKQPLTENDTPLAALLRERFEAEARLTARLEHPAIVTVYEAGRWPDGEPFYAMRLVRGAPLARLIEQRRELADRVALVAEVVKVGEALAYAHAQGVIHRDVKPDNILVGPYGQTVLIDWGLARDLDARDELPAPQAAPGVTVLGIGTPHYMPPEQATGARPDERLDIYALGATLYHVLAGEPPYAGGAATARATVLEQPPPPLVEREPRLPPALVACVERAMARDPAARFRTMAELVAELHRFQRGDLLESYRYGLAERLGRWAKRHRAALGVATIALAVLAVVVVQSVRRIVDERDERASAQLRAEAALADSLGRNASMLAQHTATRADALLAALDATAGARDSAVTRQGLVDALAAGPSVRRLDTRAGAEVLAVAASRDRIVIAGSDRALRVWTRSGELLATIQISIQRTHELHASGAHVLACGYEREAAWVDLDRGSVATIRHPTVIGACALTPAGEPVIGGVTELIRWDASGASATALPIEGPTNRLAIDRSGAVLATTGLGELWRWSDAGASHARGHEAAVFGLVVLPDGGALTSGFDGRIVRWTVQGPAPSPVAVLYDEPGAQLANTFPLDRSALPRHLAIAAQNTPETRVFVADGGVYRFAWRVRGRVMSDGNGRVLAVTDDGVLEVSPDSGATIRVLGDNEATASAIAIAGDAVLIGSKSGATLLFDLAGETAPASHDGEVVGLATTASGELASAGIDGAFVVHATPPREVRSETAIIALRTSPAGRMLVLDALGVATIVDDDGTVLLRAGSTPALDAALSSDGKIVAVAGRDAVIIRRIAGGEPVTIAEAAGATAVALDGEGVITGHLGGVVRRWSNDGARLAEHVLGTEASTGIRALAITPGGVLATLRDRTVLLDPATLAERATWPLEQIGHPGAAGWIGARSASAQLVVPTGPPRHLDGHSGVITAGAIGTAWIATGDQTGEVIVWDAATGALVTRVRAALGAPAITALVFASADVLAIGDARGAIRRIPLSLEPGIREACTRLARIGRAHESTHCP